MADWPTLLRSFDQVEPSASIPSRALARVEELGTPRRRSARRIATIIAVGAGVCLILLALALAAHSRRHTAPIANHHRSTACPIDGGGACRGTLAAGTYHTTRFAPRLTYTVPDGWTNVQDTHGSVVLRRRDGSPDEAIPLTDGRANFLRIIRNAGPANACTGQRNARSDTSAAAIASWMTNNDWLKATRRTPVRISGLRGIRLTTRDRVWCLGDGGLDSSFRYLFATPGPVDDVSISLRERPVYWLLDIPGGGNIVIIANAFRRHDHQRFLAEANAIVRQLQFNLSEPTR